MIQLLIITVRFAWFLLETRQDVCFEFTQRGRFQRLKVDFNLVGVGIFECWFTSLYDEHDAAELITCTQQYHLSVCTLHHTKAN